MAMRQKWRLAELRCEDYAFTLMSRYINAIADSGTLNAMRSRDQAAWARPIGALVLAVRHCGLSSWMPAECFAIDEDLACWQKLGASASQARPAACMPGLHVVACGILVWRRSLYHSQGQTLGP